MKSQSMHQPEDNLFILLLLIVFSCGLYYFWWIAKVSSFFGDDTVTNILLIFFTAGLWSIYLNVRYIQKSEELNNRNMQWYMIFFLPISVLITQNNINEYYSSPREETGALYDSQMQQL